MKRLIGYFLIIASSLFSIQVAAQTGTVAGRILDESNLPMAGANITVLDQGTITDNNGYFTLIEVPVGKQNLVVSFIGFATQEIEVDVSEKQTSSVEISLSTGVDLQEVVITSQLLGQAKALNNQLNRNNVTNIIAADQIGRFPDQNIGDAIKRVPGISVQYDQGEARFGSIRGTSPQLNSVTINGERIPSAEAEVREIQLDLIPSDMIQTVEVNKTVTPDMDGDAIGGSVNLVTRSAPASERISATIGSGYNLVAQKPSFNGSLIYGNRFADNKIGLIVSASYFDNNLGTDNIEAEWVYNDDNENGAFDNGEDFWTEEIQIRQYYLQRVRKSFSASLDYKFNPNHSIIFRSIYNDRNDWENRYRAVYKDIENEDGQWIAELERQTKGGTGDIKYRRLEDQKMMSFSLNGEHLFNRVKADWSAAYSEASEDRANERYFEIATDGTVPVNLDLSNPRYPMISAVGSEFQNPSTSWELSEITEEFQYTEDIDFNSRLNVTIPLGSKGNTNFIKLGTRLRTKTKTRSNDFYEYEPTNDGIFENGVTNPQDETKDNFGPGNYTIGGFVAEEYLGDLDLAGADFEREQDLSELAGNFDASENIFANYAMINYGLTDKLNMIAGVRIESTDLEYQGNVYNDEAETITPSATVENNYTNVLPSIHFRYSLTPKTILRAAYSSTLARPNYFDLVPYREIVDGEELSIGNPSLEATTSSNVDLMIEKYFGTIGIISGGVFFKDIKDFIVNQSFEDYNFEGTTWADFTQPINGGNASLLGAEIAIQRQIAKRIGVYFNYTYTQSEVTDFNFDGRENEDISLPGSPDHTLNASLSYDAKKFTTRLSVNYASDFVDEVGSEIFSDRYYDAVTYLDFNFNYSINKNWVIYANANNILNQPLRYFQGASNRTMQAEYYNVRFDLGIKYDLTR